MAVSAGGSSSDITSVQNYADVELEKRFLDAAGTDKTEARVKNWDHDAATKLMKRNVGGSGGAAEKAKPSADPKEDQYYAYGQRVNRPGLVQTFGATMLMSVGPAFCGAEWGTILAVSENSRDIMGVDPDDLVDSDLFDPATSPFDKTTLESLRNAFRGNDLSVQAPLIGSICRHKGCPAGYKAYLIAHATSEGIVIDVEPLDGNVSSYLQGSLQTHALARAAVARIQKLASSKMPRLCQAMVEETAALTGYDRVMLYKFHPDQHGEVVAECKKDGVPDSWLGLQFPATDIPQANRGILMNMSTRMIANVGAPSAGMVHSPRLHENIILANSQLRGVSGCHTQFLQNMGVQATLVLSIVTRPMVASDGSNSFTDGKPSKDGRPPAQPPLWGLLVCHHYVGPHKNNYDHRAAIDFLVKVFAIQLGRICDSDAHAAQQKVSVGQAMLCDALKAMDSPNTLSNSIGSALASALMTKGSGNVMLQIAEATGCAMFLEGKWYTVGDCPEEAHLNSLVKWMKESGKLEAGGQFGTICLHEAGFPDAEATRTTMAGVLAVDLLTRVAEPSGDAAVTLWMRGELIQEEIWSGGRNSKPQIMDGSNFMTPRQSFLAQKEIVSLQSAAWAAHEVDATQAIQLLLQDAIRLRMEGQITSRILVALNQERLRSMGELSKVSSELRAVIDSADVPVVQVDTELKVLGCNLAAENLFASESGEMPDGVPFVNFLNDDDQPVARAAMMKAIEEGKDPSHLEVKLKPTGRSNTPMELSIYIHVKHSITGEVDSMMLMCRDLTSQKNLMYDLVARERDCEELIQNSTSPMFCVDGDGRVTEWSSAMEKLTGIEKEFVITQLAVGDVFGTSGKLRIMASQASVDAMTELSAGLVSVLGDNEGQSDPPADVNFSFVKRPAGSEESGKQIDVALSCRRRLGSSGDIIGAFCFIQDLTVPNALEKAIAVQTATEAAAEAKTRHIAFLCHEIRNPVNGILATVQAMEEMMTHSENDDLDVDEMFDLVKTTMACTDQLRRTVDGILDINKLEEGKLDVTTAPFKVSSVLRTVVSQVVKASEEKSLTLECELSPELVDVVLNGDEGRIQQVLANFCWNSVKFTATGGIKILVESEPSERPGHLRLFFKVVDTGKGMDRKTQESLFQRYAMGQHRVGKYGGSGLGLSICRSLAELMNGHVHCFSTLGKGSTFVLEVELEIESKPPAQEAPSKAPEPTPVSSEKESAPEAPVPAADPPAAGPAPSHQDSAAPAPHVAPPLQPAPSALQPPYPGYQQFPGPQPPMQPPAAPMQTFYGNPYAQQQMTYSPNVGQFMFQNNSATRRLDAAMAGTGGWNLRAVRESVFDASVAVLIEVDVKGGARQQWGGAPITGGNVAAALTAAHEDALRRIADLYCSQGPMLPIPSQGYAPQSYYGFGNPASYTPNYAAAQMPMMRMPPAMPPGMPSGMPLGLQNMMQNQMQNSMIGGSAPMHMGGVPNNHPWQGSHIPQDNPNGNHASPSDGGSAWPPIQMPAAEMQPAQAIQPQPAPRPGTSEPEPVKEAPVEAEEPKALKTVLAVDDDTVNLKVLHRALTRGSDLDVTLAEDGQDIIKLLITEGRRFDMVLLDENMQRMNGSVAASAYRKYEAQNKLPPTPLIVTTGNSAPHDVMRYNACGIDGIIAKPMTLRTMLKDITTYYHWHQKHGPHQPDISKTGEEVLAPASARRSAVLRKDSEMFMSSLFFGNMEVFGKLKDPQY